jgi:hypothetical protein
MISLAESARWAGFRSSERNWILIAQCSGERFLALVRSGMPTDLAWSQTCEWMGLEAPTLAAAWGFSVWQIQARTENYGSSAVVVDLGNSIKKAVQLSVMEGRPCMERVESALYAFSQELRAQVSRELSLLGNRALKPLFLCVAPSILGLMITAMYLCWLQSGAPGAF